MHDGRPNSQDRGANPVPAFGTPPCTLSGPSESLIARTELPPLGVRSASGPRSDPIDALKRAGLSRSKRPDRVAPARPLGPSPVTRARGPNNLGPNNLDRVAPAWQSVRALGPRPGVFPCFSQRPFVTVPSVPGPD